MKTLRFVFVLAGCLGCLNLRAAAQNQSAPPVILDVVWEIARYAGSVGSFDFFEPFVPFDPDTEIAFEKDRISLTCTVTDLDFDGTEGDSAYVIFQSGWLPLIGYQAPEPPPIVEDFDSFFPEDTGLYPQAGNILTVTHVFQIPTFIGANQARLRGDIDYDVVWWIDFGVSNSQDPRCIGNFRGMISGPCEEYVAWYLQLLYAVQNPLILTPNPPPFADAGADRSVNPGTVILDGSRSIDLYNVGFNTQSGDVFDKDILSYTWEWISGPARVDPEQDVESNPRATVDLTVKGTYIYRLTVDDNYNDLPSTDSVAITVTDLPVNHPPIALIDAEPAGKRSWTVGQTVTLVSESFDPDEDELEYRWQQIDELGGQLPLDTLVKVFQPLSGMTSAAASWQALLPGKYYFRLLINDAEYTDATTVEIEIVASSAAGETVTNTGNGDTTTGDGSALLSPGACGVGFAPWALLPLAYCAWRRRG